MAALTINLSDALQNLSLDIDDFSQEDFNKKFNDELNTLNDQLKPVSVLNPPRNEEQANNEEQDNKARKIIQQIQQGRIQVLNDEQAAILEQNQHFNKDTINKLRCYLKVKEALALQAANANFKLIQQLENEQKVKELRQKYAAKDEAELKRIKELFLKKDTPRAAFDQFENVVGSNKSDFVVFQDPVSGESLAKVFKWESEIFDEVFSKVFSAGAKVSIPDFVLRSPKEQQIALKSAIKNHIDIVESLPYRLGLRMSNTAEQNYQAILTMESHFTKTGYPKWCNKKIVKDMKELVLANIEPAQRPAKEAAILASCFNEARDAIKTTKARELLAEYRFKPALCTADPPQEQPADQNPPFHFNPNMSLVNFKRLYEAKVNGTTDEDLKARLQEMGIDAADHDAALVKINTAFRKAHQLEEDLGDHLIHYAATYDLKEFTRDASWINRKAQKAQEEATQRLENIKTSINDLLNSNEAANKLNFNVLRDIDDFSATKEQLNTLCTALAPKVDNYPGDLTNVTKEQAAALAKQLDAISNAKIFGINDEEALNQLQQCQQRLNVLKTVLEKAKPNEQIQVPEGSLTRSELLILQQNLLDKQRQFDFCFSCAQANALINYEKATGKLHTYESLSRNENSEILQAKSANNERLATPYNNDAANAIAPVP